jgi:hypothetical protein
VRRLEALDAREWRVVGPPYSAGEIDYVAVGPTGAFVVAHQDWPGRITVRNELLREDERSRDRLVQETAAAVEALATALPVDLRTEVHPVIVLIRDEPLVLTTRNVLVCSSASFVPALTRGAPVWGPDHIAFVAAVLHGRLARQATDDLALPRPRRATAQLVSQRPPQDDAPPAGRFPVPRPRRSGLGRLGTPQLVVLIFAAGLLLGAAVGLLGGPDLLNAGARG